MPRQYCIPFHNVSVSALQDLVQYLVPSPHYGEVTRVVVADVDSTITTGMELQLRCRVHTGTISNGPGSAGTINKLDQGDSASNADSAVNQTAQCTGATADVVVMENGCEIRQGLDFSFPSPIPVVNGNCFTFELTAAPIATVHLSGCIYVTERGT